MPEGTKIPAKGTVATLEKSPSPERTPEGQSTPPTLQAQLLRCQTTDREIARCNGWCAPAFHN